MAEPMQVRLEVWPLAADNLGIWLISDMDAWRPELSVAADDLIHANVELELAGRGVDLHQVRLLHSTSWHQHGPALMLTYVAVVEPTGGYVRRDWPAAKPVSTVLAERLGPAPWHGAAEPPNPRYADVLLHGTRHLRWLRDTDDSAAAALRGVWWGHLDAFAAAHAKMYCRCPEGCPA